MKQAKKRGSIVACRPIMEAVERRQFLSAAITTSVATTSGGSSAVTIHPATTDSSLPAPTIVSPGSGASPGTPLTTLTPTFTWNAVTGVSSMTGYQLNLYDSTAAKLTSIQIASTATSYTPSTALTAGHNYVWNLRIVAQESSGTVTGTESNYLHFQTPGSTTTIGVPVVT
ncbi:MAG: hypothetical protein JO353_08145, partial [Phycisphaerae bacterium]|nr:hypothetical protein [Phycisphaerae bacterium]